MWTILRRAVIVVLLVVTPIVAIRAWEYRQEQSELNRRFDCPTGLAGRLPASASGAPAARLALVAEFEEPVALASFADRPPLEPAVVFVAEKGGAVWRLVGDTKSSEPVIDLRGQVATGYEQGLLGLALDPTNRHLYLNYTDRENDTHVTAYRVLGEAGEGGVERVGDVLAVDQPTRFHNAGHLAFGPDGMLYIALGDGGGPADPTDNGQDPSTLLGSILRVDPRPGEDPPYLSPPDNPFAGRADGRPEVWAYGMRNPWRFSFDRSTGDVWVADVGDGCFEEITHLPADQAAGSNLGWDRVEGPWVVDPPAPADAVGATFSYLRQPDACAVIGGQVYRGTALPDLRGLYVFGDLCRVGLMTLDPSRPEAPPQPLAVPVGQPVSLAEAPDGELWVISLDGGVHRLIPN